jgi:hypothetical protein
MVTMLLGAALSRRGRAEPRSSRQWLPATRVGWPRPGVFGCPRVTVAAAAGAVVRHSPRLVLLLAKPPCQARGGGIRGYGCHRSAIMVRALPPNLPTTLNALVCPIARHEVCDDPGSQWQLDVPLPRLSR